MTELWERLQAGLLRLGSVLPAFLGALVIVLAGYLLARQLQKWTDATLNKLGFDKVAREQGLEDVVQRAAHLDPRHAAANLVFWLVMLVVILLASTALGLESINRVFGQLLSYIPTLLAAIVIIILGMITGEFVRVLILASAGKVSGVPTVAKIAKGAVVLVAIFMALQQLGVADDIVSSAFTLILGAVALAAGLAFGLGNKDLAGEVTRRWYEAGQRRDRRKDDKPPPPEQPERPVLMD